MAAFPPDPEVAGLRKSKPQKETARLFSLVVGPEMLSPGLLSINVRPSVIICQITDK
jgi:hypothetical protein